MKRYPPFGPGGSSGRIPLCAILAPLFVFVAAAVRGDTVIYDQNFHGISSIADWPRPDHWVDQTDSAPTHSGKVEFKLAGGETDIQARGDLELNVAAPGPPPFGYPHLTILNGRQLIFHVAPPMSGDVEVWFYEPNLPQHGFSFNVDGVGVTTGHYGYTVFFGRDPCPPPVAPRAGMGEPFESTSIPEGWHYLRWEFRQSTVSGSDFSRRIASVYYQRDCEHPEILIGRHGCPNGAHSLAVQGDRGTSTEYPGRFPLYLARVKFTQRDGLLPDGPALYVSPPE